MLERVDADDAVEALGFELRLVRLRERSQIEDAAAEWEREKRDENRAWPESRILDAMREIGRSGVSLDDVARPDTVRAFLGPTDPDELAKLPSLTEADRPRLADRRD